MGFLRHMTGLIAALLLSALSAMATPVAPTTSLQTEVFLHQRLVSTDHQDIHFAAKAPPLTTTNVAFTGFVFSATACDQAWQFELEKRRQTALDLISAVGILSGVNCKTVILDAAQCKTKLNNMKEIETQCIHAKVIPLAWKAEVLPRHNARSAKDRISYRSKRQVGRSTSDPKQTFTQFTDNEGLEPKAAIAAELRNGGLRQISGLSS